MSFANKAKKGLEVLGDAVWFQMGEKEVRLKKDSLKSCLVGRWGVYSDLVSELQILKKWAVCNWRLKRGVDLFLLRRALILFKFDSFEDAEEVMHRGLRRFANKCLSLERWSSKVGCFRRDVHAKEVWGRLVGICGTWRHLYM